MNSLPLIITDQFVIYVHRKKLMELLRSVSGERSTEIVREYNM